MSGFRRIDTLIPYKEPEFRPRKKRLGALDPDKSVWATSAQLGRYLLSGAEEEDIEEIALSAASSLLGLELEPAEPDETEAAIMRERAKGPCSTFRDPDGDGTLIVVAHSKDCGDMLGRNSWSYGRTRHAALTIGMRLDEAVGLAEIVDNAGGLEGMRETARELEEVSFLVTAQEKREQFKDWEKHGMVKLGPPDNWSPSRKQPFATVTKKNGCRKYLYDDWRLYVEGSADDLAAGAEEAGRQAASLISEKLMPYVFRHNKETNKGTFASALLISARGIWQDEGERVKDRNWLTEQLTQARTARVFEDKKNPDREHVAAARNGFIGRSFAHTEVDNQCDLDEFAALQDELEARIKCGEIPQIDTKAHDLRFRLLGRHRALGIYFPHSGASPTPCIAVDCRYPASLLHEFAHAYDHEHGRLSRNDERFRNEIMRPFNNEFERKVREGNLPFSPRNVEYYTAATEVFARSWEVYASVNGFGGSFVKKPEEYARYAPYKGLLDRKDAICAYFDGFARPREKAHVLTARERAEELLNDDGRDNSGELRRMVAAGSVDTAELSAHSLAAARRLDELAEYEATLAAPGGTHAGQGEQMSIFDCMDER